MKKPPFFFVQRTPLEKKSAHAVYIVRVVEAATSLGYKSTLITPSKNSKKLLDSYYQPSTNILTTDTTRYFFARPNFLNIPYDIYFSLRAWQKVNSGSIVQTSDPETALLYSQLKRTKPINIIYDVHIQPPNWLTPKTVGQIDLFIVNCDYFKQQLTQKGFSPSKIVTLPNGYNPEEYADLNPSKIRKHLNLNPQSFVFGYIGRFYTTGQEKGVGQLLQLAAQLQADIPLVPLIVGSPKPALNHYRQLANKLGFQHAIFKDQVSPSQVASYISAFDLAWLVYPDTPHFRYKMSPMKAVEYMAAGAPIIASDFPSIRQLLDQKQAYLVDPSDPAQIKQTIKEVYSNPTKALNKASRAQKKVKQHTWTNRQQIIFDQLTSPCSPSL